MPLNPARKESSLFLGLDERNQVPTILVSYYEALKLIIIQRQAPETPTPAEGSKGVNNYYGVGKSEVTEFFPVMSGNRRISNTLLPARSFVKIRGEGNW